METKNGWPEALWIVRHAESVGNAARSAALAAGERTIALPARDPDIPLSERGVEQARALGRWFGGSLAPEPPTAILISPYRRTRQTAQELADAAGWRLFSALDTAHENTARHSNGKAASGPAIPLIVDERLREKDAGRLEGLTRSGISARYPHEVTAYDQLGKFYYRPPGGESWCDVVLRLRSLIDTIRAAYGGGRLLIVGHQVIVVCLRYVLEGLDEASVLDLERPGEVANASVTSYRREGERLTLTAFNTVAPLEAEGVTITAEPPASTAAPAALPATADHEPRPRATIGTTGDDIGGEAPRRPTDATGHVASAPAEDEGRESAPSAPATPTGGDPPRPITPRLLARWPLPKPATGGSKEERGRVLIVGGDATTPGGALLATTAALRAGAGKVQLALAETIAPSAAVAIPEARVTPLPITPDGVPDPAGVAALEDDCRRAAVVAVGPGLVDPEAAGALVERIAGWLSGGTFLVDAAALAGVTPGLGDAIDGQLLLTPNMGEMARLLDRSPEEIGDDPEAAALLAAERFGAVVALKGRETWIVDRCGGRYLNRAGNVGLAISGSGDVLVGIIAGLIARGAAPDQAAVWGVHVHGRAADYLGRTLGPLGYLPSELPALLPHLFMALDRRTRQRR